MQSTNTSNGVFSANKITKYFKNQEIPSLNGNFVDPLFPPKINSIIGTDSNGNFIDAIDGQKKSSEIAVNDIDWMRAGEIFGKYLLFDEKIECSDIKQGSLGNCYFLSALAALTEFPQLIYQIFRTKEINEAGYYEMVLFVDGEWVVVQVDDYFPVKKGSKNFSFAKPNGNELWVILLEKAWAKVNGGYANIIGGKPSDALAALTGFGNQTITVKDVSRDELWDILKISDQSDNIMCCSTKPDPSIEKVGLVENHAYTLVGAKDREYNGQTLRLVHIRNPWGQKEWQGEWSDNDSKWDAELNAFYNHTVEDDGTFFMSLEDFVQLFDTVNICHVMYNSNIKTFKVSSQQVNTPHVFNLYLPETSKVSFSVLTKHWRYNRNLKNVTHPFSIIIARYEKNSNKLVDVDGEYSGYENLEFNKALSKGVYAVWVFCGQSQSMEPKPQDYIVRFASTTRYRVALESYDQSFEFIRELIIAGVREKFQSQIEAAEGQYYGIENQFKRTGFGYRCVINKSATAHQKWTNDPTQMQGMFMLPPHEGKDSFDFVVPPLGTGICIGMRTQQYGTYWFNIKSQYVTNTCQQGQDPTNTRKVNIEQYVNSDISLEEVNDHFYDYISSSLSDAKKDLEFLHIDTQEVALDELKTEHPELMQHLLELHPVEDETGLVWGKLNFDNGLYVGQLTSTNSRHGRGVYQWAADGTAYAGYWINNTRDKMGKLLDKNFKVTYEGGYLNGIKSGKGKLCFNNGDVYEGEFVQDKRHGKGLYVWGDGSKWLGNFENNQMKGIGLYTPNDGSDPWDYEF